MCDKLVFDLAQEVEGSPSVFVRKDWINILDNQTSNYTSNQSVVDTSQLSNSNKYMSYRESYFLLPMTLTLASLGQGYIRTGTQNAVVPAATLVDALGSVMQPAPDVPATPDLDDYIKSLDNAIGLKNWFGNIIHSFTLDYNGSTIIQQTPFVNMWNSFKLMTSLSYNDVITQGCTIGFYPDNAESVAFNFIDSIQYAGQPAYAGGDLGAYTTCINGNGTINNNNYEGDFVSTNRNYQTYTSGLCNQGLKERLKWITYDADAQSGYSYSGSLYKSLLTKSNCSNLWKSYIVAKQNQVVAAGDITQPGADGTGAVPTNGTFKQTTPGLLQIGIVATIYLKHIHSFFNMCPLLKGVFMKMTMNLNNSASTVIVGSNVDFVGLDGDPLVPTVLPADSVANLRTAYQICTASSSALGGTNPMMLSSLNNGAGSNNLAVSSITIPVAPAAVGNAKYSVSQAYRMSLSVGNKCLDAQTNQIAGLAVGALPCQSIYLYIPAYTFNPPFEQAYISSPVKSIKYTDIYQYQVLGVGGSEGGQFNNLLTNGIANIKSVLILPFFSTQNDGVAPLIAPATNITNGYFGTTDVLNAVSANTGFVPGIPVWQSPFDPAGSGATSPLCHFTNFNVQVSGMNSIYNLQLRAFEQFNNQLYGQNAVNGGLTDGITSSLVNRQSFDLEYCYYYVNVERMLPVEQSVPKSVQILGTSYSQKKLDLLCFIEYGTEVSIDVLTGARV